eukprot:1696626-Rhodomonas_salina.1
MQSPGSRLNRATASGPAIKIADWPEQGLDLAQPLSCVPRFTGKFGMSGKGKLIESEWRVRVITIGAIPG